MRVSEVEEFVREAGIMDMIRHPTFDMEALPCGGCGKRTTFRVEGVPVCCYKCMTIIKVAPIV